MTSILLVSDHENVYNFILQAVSQQNNIMLKKYEYSQISNMKERDYQTAIMYFDKDKLIKGSFKFIFELRCKFKVPILVVTEGGSTRDKLNILNFGAEDYLEWPFQENEFLYKLECLCRLKRY